MSTTTLPAAFLADVTMLADALDDHRADHADECDAPSDWDAGTVNFDPYI